MKLWIWLSHGEGYGVDPEYRDSDPDMRMFITPEVQIRPEHIDKVCVLNAAIDTSVELTKTMRRIACINGYGCIYGRTRGGTNRVHFYEREYYLYDTFLGTL